MVKPHPQPPARPGAGKPTGKAGTAISPASVPAIIYTQGVAREETKHVPARSGPRRPYLFAHLKRSPSERAAGQPRPGPGISVFISLFTAAFVFLAGCPAFPLSPQTSPSAGGTVFSITAPAARSVAVVGSFNNWDRGRHRLAGPDGSGRWRIAVTLRPGRYEYLFLIDGKTWVTDPAAATVSDGMGGSNSVLIVPPGRTAPL